MSCQVCGNSKSNRSFLAKEMMFGLRSEFEYMECGNCFTVQIVNVPHDLVRYYPKDYYSFSGGLPTKGGFITSYIRKERAKWLADGNFSIIGILSSWLLPKPEPYKWIKQLGIRRTSSILEVGCGNGALLNWLSNEGFTNLTGVDPFVEKDISNSNGFMVYKKKIQDLSGLYDCIMLNHSFEHMPSPHNTMRELSRILTQDGRLLIRIPISNTYAWSTYGADWVQLDAPRHLFLYSQEAVKILCQESDLVVDLIEFDSNDFQFWGSEQYRQDIPLRDELSWAINPHLSKITKDQIKDFRKKAIELNRKGDGDQACFYIRKGKALTV